MTGKHFGHLFPTADSSSPTRILQKCIRFHQLMISAEMSDDEILVNFFSNVQRIRQPNYFEEWVPQCDDNSFIELFRIKRSTYLKIVEFVAKDLNSPVHRRGKKPIPIGKKCLMGILYLSSQQPIVHIAERFNVSEWAVYQAINTLIDGFLCRTSSLIFWPCGDEFEFISKQFEEISARPNRKGFPDVIGAIGVCDVHCLIEEEHAKEYLKNRKMLPSIRLQGVCDSACLFTQVSVGAPGCVNDPTAMHFSHLNETLVPENFHLIGDSAYTLMKWMMVPFRDTGRLTAAEKSYNVTLSRARVKIENAFGQLKGRWRRLQLVNAKSISKVNKIIMACCLLHNFCLREGDVFENSEAPVAENNEDNEESTQRPHPAALAKRNRIKNDLWIFDPAAKKRPRCQ